MIKIICKYYLKFPPMARTVIDFSFQGVIGFAGVDFYHAPEHLLLECDDLLKIR